MLLRELRRLTTQLDHPEIPCLDKAESLLSALADDINKALVDKENSVKLVEISNILNFKNNFQVNNCFIFMKINKIL